MPGATELIIVAVIVLILFGTSKLKNLGSDLGSAIKGFKTAVSEDDKTAELEADEKAPLTKEESVTQKEKT